MKVSQSSEFGLSWFRDGLLTPRFRAVALGACFVLAATVGVAAVPQLAVAALAATKVAQPVKTSAPDLVSALVTARAQGSPVEVEALRAATSTTWANPGGTMTTRAHAGEIRFKDAKGEWRDVDLSMAERTDGTVGAKSHRLGVSLAGKDRGAAGSAKSAAETDLVAVDEAPGKDKSARQVTLAWRGALPAPVLEGTRATYRDAAPGLDVVVESRRSGFEQLTVIRDRAALGRLVAAAPAGGVSWSLPVKTKGLTARAEADGSVSFVDAKGVVVSSFKAPVAWDGEVDERSGEHVNVSAVRVSVAQKGKGRAVLTLTPDPAWLAEPGRVFPVTVDPTYATASNVVTSFDTYVQTGKTWDTSTETELRVGTSDGGASIKARSYLNFSTSTIRGKDIKSASLSLYETHSYSCTAKTIYAYDSATASTATRWTDLPAVGTASGSASFAKGYSSSCADGRVSIPVTNVLKGWAAGTATSRAIRLTASETDSYAWKKFASVETSTDPYVTFTYNRKPNQAAAPTLALPDTSYTNPSGTVLWYTNSSKPTMTSTGTDPDGNAYTITVEVHSSTTGSNLVTWCTSPRTAGAYTPSGTPAKCQIGTQGHGSALVDNTTYYARTAISDDQGLWNGTWSPWTTFRTAVAAPVAPTITCPAPYTNGSWATTKPASPVTCTVTAASTGTNAPVKVMYSLDGAAYAPKPITASSDPAVAKFTLDVPNTDGSHSITAYSLSASSVRSVATSSYQFGYGSASLTSPVNAASSTGKLTVTASAQPKVSATSVKARLQWRVAASGAGTSGWTDSTLPEADVTPTNTTTAAKYTSVFDLQSAVQEAGASAPLATRVPVRLDLQVCFTFTGESNPTRCTWSQSPVSATRLPHAFGAGYPVTDAGVGQLAQYTGEIALSGTDVSVAGYTGDISIARSHTSFSGDGTLTGWPTDPVTGVFGPGFTANLEGGEAGLAGLQVLDNTRIDGSVVFLDEDGEPLVFANPAGTRTYAASGTTYDPATQDTLDSGINLTLTGTGTGTVLTLKEEDGTTTTWTPTAAPSLTTTTVWKPATITEPGQSGSTTFGHDASTGRVTRIVAPVPDDMVGSCPTTGALVQGCRALDITYATATSGTFPGDYAGRVKAVTATMWNPTTSAMATTTVATYQYDSSGRLVSIRDPRTGLGSDYTWSGTSTRIGSVKASGQAATKLAYDAQNRLSQVSREAPVSGGADVVTARYVYGVATSGAGLPTVSDAVTAYGQATAPVTGFAVFGQDYTGPVTGTGIDWTYADLAYTDALGYTVNTAAYGAGQWGITSTDYDAQDNIVRTLDAGAATTARDNPAWTDAQVDALSTQTYYNTEQVFGGTVVLPAGSRVTDEFGPARLVALTDGTEVNARPHTATTYDQNAPTTPGFDPGINPNTKQRYSLPTTVTVGAAAVTAVPGQTDLQVTSTTTTGYAKLSSTDTTEGDGWALGAATTTTTGGITRTTRYDTMGRATDTRQPLSTGTDAGTTKTAYYTAAAQPAPNATCGGKTEWAGLTCHTYPAAQPAGATIADSVTTGYSMWLQPTTEVETSGATSRTTTTWYDTAERAYATVTTSTIAGSTARNGTYTQYDATTGAVAYTGWANSNTTPTDAQTAGRTTNTYDLWGRVTQVVGDAGTLTTTYDTAGRVQSVQDAKGTSTYGYDGTGERRGLVTSLTVTRGGTADPVSYGASYDIDGNLAQQSLPGNLTQVTTYDQAGEPVGLAYLGQVTPVTESTDPDTGEVTYTPGTPLPDQPWITWSTVNDITGRARFEATGTGAAFDNGNGVTTINDVTDWTADAIGQASSYDREYRYDDAGRLTFARDAATGVDPSTNQIIATCTDRAYTFDGNGRRTALATTARPDGDCAATGTTTTVTTTGYDTADRPTTGRGGDSYVYDTFGRQTTLPASDAPNGSAAVTLGYYDDDLPRTITQGTTTTTFTLDADSRRATQTTVDAAGTTTTLRRYTDAGDNPAWVEVTPPGASTPTITRFTESIAGDLSASIAADASFDLSLANPHGDVVTTVPFPDADTIAPAAAITGWATYDEHGNTTTADPVDGPLGYGWLGAKQRSTSAATAGLTLMGVRLYNATRGLFTAVDPVAGGNENVYAYPSDPVNASDLDGRWWGWRKTLRRAAKITGFVALGACIVASAGLCAAATAGAIAASVAWNGYQKRHGDDHGRRVSWKRTFANIGIDAAAGRFRAVRSVTRYAKHGRPVARLLRSYGRHRARSYQVTRSLHFVVRHQPWRTAGRVGVQAFYGYRSHTTPW
jgi:RHS repeat-associated protein